MMTTTMMGMKKVIEKLKEKNPNVMIMLGGAPVTGEVANCSAPTATPNRPATPVAEGIRMIARLREMQKK